MVFPPEIFLLTSNQIAFLCMPMVFLLLSLLESINFDYWCYLKIWNLAMQLLRCYSLRLIHPDHDCLHTLVQVGDFSPSPPPFTMFEFIKLYTWNNCKGQNKWSFKEKLQFADSTLIIMEYILKIKRTFTKEGRVPSLYSAHSLLICTFSYLLH